MALHWKIIIGLILGAIWAILSSYLGWSEFTLNWIDPFGKIFINLLKMIAMPIVLFSLIKGVAELADISKLGRLGFKTLSIYIVTTVFAVSLGLFLVNTIKPGLKIADNQKIENRISYELWCNQTGNEIKDSKRFLDDPKYASYVDNAQNISNNGDLLIKQKKILSAQKNKRPLQFLVDVVPTNIFQSLTSLKSMLQVIFFAVFFGAMLLVIPKEKAKPLSKIIDALNEVFLKMVDYIMKSAPFFVFALLAGKLSELAGNEPSKLFDTFYSLGACCVFKHYSILNTLHHISYS